MDLCLNQLPFVILVIVVFMASSNVKIAQCQLDQQEPQPQQHQQQQQQHATRQQRGLYLRNAVDRAVHYNRTAMTSSHNTCEYKELMTNIHDRVGTLVTWDEDHRNRLTTLEKKIVQFEENNLARLDSIGVHQMDTSKRLEVVEHMQRLNNRLVEDMKSELEQLRAEQQKRLENASEGTNAMRVSRQINASDVEQQTEQTLPDTFRLDCSGKLEALSILLTSTRIAISQLAENLTRLTQMTSNLQRRFNNFARRQQDQSVVRTYHQPSLYASDIARPFDAVCSNPTPGNSLGIQKLQLATNAAPFYVACDDKIQGGGWTVIQNRYSGEINFQRDWLEYRTGFGNVAGEFFIGLDKLHALTTASLCELLILLADADNVERYARYSSFAIGGEKELYALNLLGTYSGDAGDSLSYHAGSKFSTFDNDNDGWLEGNCALAHTGAWWYNACEKSNLNGQYLNGEYDPGQTFQGMYWQDFHGPTYALRSVRMMIRPVTGEQEQRR